MQKPVFERYGKLEFVVRMQGAAIGGMGKGLRCGNVDVMRLQGSDDGGWCLAESLAGNPLLVGRLGIDIGTQQPGAISGSIEREHRHMMIQYGDYRDLRTGLNCVEKCLHTTHPFFDMCSGQALQD